MSGELPLIESWYALAQAAPGPAVDAALVARIASRAIHILCAIILGGGLFYLRTILAPSGAGACFAERRALWAQWVGIATFLLLASGLFNFMVILREYRDAGTKLPSMYHMLFGIKVLLSLLVLFIAAILAGKTAAAERFRGNMSKWLNLAWASVMAIVILGAMLRAQHVRQRPLADPAAPAATETHDG